MTSLKIWLFISIMCFVTYEIHVSAAAMKTSVKKPALSSSSKSEPRRVTTLLMKTVTKDYQTSELVSIANEMNSDEFMGVTDKKSKKYLFAQQMRMDFLNRLETRLLDDIRDVRSEDIMGADSDKLLNEIMDAYSVFSKFRPVPNAKLFKTKTYKKIFALINHSQYESMWTFSTVLDSRREFFDLPTKSEIIACAIDDIMYFCTRTSQEKLQIERFKKHLDFLASDRFTKSDHDESISMIKKCLHSMDRAPRGDQHNAKVGAR
eukprot:225267_1